MINVYKLDSVSSVMNSKMNKFEESFRYPLGNEGTFSISHGDDYARFFRAMGKCRIYVASSGEEVLGSMVLVHRPVMINGCQRKAVYIGDLKIKQGSGKVLYCLIKEAHDDNLDMREFPHYGVMMKGTPRKPSDYTGRLGLPKFKNMGEVGIIRVPVFDEQINEEPEHIGLQGAVSLCQELTREENAFPIGRASIRSLCPPKAYALKDKSAVCVLEDTMTAKRLYAEDGSEIVSGHLSSFQYNRIAEGERLIRAVMPFARANAYPALFFSVPLEDSHYFLKKLKGATLAPAFIYGRNMEASGRWQLNSSEI